MYTQYVKHSTMPYIDINFMINIRRLKCIKAFSNKKIEHVNVWTFELKRDSHFDL